MDKLKSLRNRVQQRAHTVHHAHHYAELAYCVAALADLHTFHAITVGGLAVVVVLSLIAND